jgi:serine/threonine protein kinase
VVKLAAAFQTEEKLYMCLEYVEGGELFVHLRRYVRSLLTRVDNEEFDRLSWFVVCEW